MPEIKHAYDGYVNFDVTVSDQVASVVIHNPLRRMANGHRADHHWELAAIMNDLRLDNDVRVVVLSGAQPGEFFVPAPPEADRSVGAHHIREEAGDPKRLWLAATGIVKAHEAMASLDRPIVAKVNGDAIGFGSSVMFASDLIVAREDARIADNHMGMGEVEPYLVAGGVVPGDGGVSLLPLFMTPAKAKEYLMLAREYTARELADMGVINYALPAGELDERVDAIVCSLLRRPAYALAWTKRVANKHVVEQLQRTLDAGIAYELVNMYQSMLGGGDGTRLA
jgi:enoyl-CoA hydratase